MGKECRRDINIWRNRRFRNINISEMGGKNKKKYIKKKKRIVERYRIRIGKGELR